jgi:hypothetical protein
MGTCRVLLADGLENFHRSVFVQAAPEEESRAVQERDQEESGQQPVVLLVLRLAEHARSGIVAIAVDLPQHQAILLNGGHHLVRIRTIRIFNTWSRFILALAADALSGYFHSFSQSNIFDRHCQDADGSSGGIPPPRRHRHLEFLFFIVL